MGRMLRNLTGVKEGVTEGEDMKKFVSLASFFPCLDLL
jgi:hypothetical protein